MSNVSVERIESFLNGTDPQKYIVAIEANYNEPFVELVVNDPETGKTIEKHKYKPFLWFKEDVTTLIYGGKRLKIIEACRKYGIKIKSLRTTDEEGNEPKRLANGYRFIALCDKSYNDLIRFFKDGGIDVFNKDYSKLFMMFSPSEQFLIQSGKRLFKGMDDYNDVHRLQFDLETHGLLASKDAIFQIGVRDNRGLEGVLETIGDTDKERRDSERENIQKFFQIIDVVKPDIIAGYNSENFDWQFIFDRAERLYMDVTELAITLNRLHKIKRKDATLKLGGESESYKQTMMYGYNIIDIAHAVRRAQAINSEIKGWGLKYITQYSGIAKANRVYVPGDKIHSTWKDTVNQYAFNDTNGDWYIISDRIPLKEGYNIVTGAYIVKRYLIDDLWETEQIDTIFNQAAFLIAKMLPTTYMRSTTMGTASQWKLIMSAWSYENDLAIPETETKRDFTGGLSRLLEVGYAKNVSKEDFAALYPKTQLTWNIFPDLDISGVMKGLLTYVVDTRDKFKFLTTEHKDKAKGIQKDLDGNSVNYTPEKINELKKELSENKALAGLYDKKQLPLKILANSWFGAYGAPYIFNWGDTDCAEETTCRGRQSLRFMVKFFTEKYGFRPLVLDTDGCNFAIPDNISDIKYTAKGTHWKTTTDAGKELVGLDAVLAEFNEEHMIGWMGLDTDDICDSTINFARKNYANDIGGKIKLVGNSIKSKKMPTYIEDFLGKGIRLLLDGKGKEFIDSYQDYVEKIYNYQIPVVKIASKSKVKSNMVDYRKKATMKNKAGNPMPKQAHMELALKENLDITLGDVIYYINTGSSKSHGDLKSVKDKETKQVTTTLNCKLIPKDAVEKDYETLKELDILYKAIAVLEENDPTRKDLQEKITDFEDSLITMDEYNIAKYLEAFNKKIKPLLVCFHPDIRAKILLNIVKIKDKETKTTSEKLQPRNYFTTNECQLVSGMPNKPTDQDTYEDLMKMEDKEIKFWSKVNKLPNFMTPEEWEVIRSDYFERLEKAKTDGIASEKIKIEEVFKRLEVADYDNIKLKGQLPITIFEIADIDFNGSPYLISRKWNEPLCPINDLFKYETEAIKRNEYYLFNNTNGDDRYEQWLDYMAEQAIMTGDTIDMYKNNKEINIDVVVDKIKEVSKTIVLKTDTTKNKLKKSQDDDESDDDDELNEDNNIDEIMDPSLWEDGVDELQPEIPDDYEITSSQIEEIKEEEDEWGF
jgi:DNA polymerase elongation subunit (family B)